MRLCEGGEAPSNETVFSVRVIRAQQNPRKSGCSTGSKPQSFRPHFCADLCRTSAERCLAPADELWPVPLPMRQNLALSNRSP